jgi:ISXO2-like transposase domain
VTVGTIFEASHVPLRLWLQAFYLIAGSKKGISANQLHRTLGVTLKTAWFMGHRIREAMRIGSLIPPMGGEGNVVEIDETIHGRASSHPKGRGKFYNSVHKNVILSLVERGGSVRSYHVAASSISEVIPIINANVKRETALMTDAAQIYKFRLSNFASHDRVDHSKNEYVRCVNGAPTVHTNTVEGYFSLFKRGMRGVYQHCQEKHLHRYLAEFDFRYNNRIALGVTDEARAAKMLKGAQGKRLTYRTTGGHRSEATGSRI